MLRAGAARIDITPRKGIWMAGLPPIGTPDADDDMLALNYTPRLSPSVGVHDPLYARALVLDDGRTTLGILAIDCLWLTASVTSEVRQWALAHLQIPAEALVLNCSHTHSGAEWTEIGEASFQPEVPEDVRAAAISGIETALAQARARLAPCRLAFGSGTMGLVQVNRRDREGPIVEQMPVLRLELEDGQTLAVMLCFACHPTVLYSDCLEYSADYPGEVCRVLEQAYPGAVALFLQGAAGNIAPVSFPFESREPLSLANARVVAQGLPSIRTHSHAARIGRVVAGEALLALERLVPRDEAGLSAEAARVALPMKKREDVAWYCRYFSMAPARRDWLLSLKEFPAEVQLLRVGGLRMVCLPGEPFAEYALEFTRFLGPDTWVLGYCGDYPGYLCTDAAYEEPNRYENRATVLAPGTFDAVRETVRRLAGET